MLLESLCYRTSIALAWFVALCVVAIGTVSVAHPSIYSHNSSFLWFFGALLLGSGAFLLVATHPWSQWRQGRLREIGTDYWLNQHPGRFFAIVGFLALALGVVIVVGLSAGVGGNETFYQVGSRYFRSGGDCRVCPRVRISEGTYFASIRALGLFQSFLLMAFSLILILNAMPLRKALREEVATR